MPHDATGSSAPLIRGPKANPSKPTFKLPPGTVDSHCHIFGPDAVFPYDPHRTFTPPDAPKEQLQALHDMLGVERAVLVQSATHGSDPAAMLDAIASRPGKYKGTTILGADATSDTVAELNELGVCGTRLHLVAHLGEQLPMEAMLKHVALVTPFGWHIELHVFGADLIRNFDMIASIETNVVIDHMARVDLAEGLEGKAVQDLLKLLERGNIWVKLSGPERMTKTVSPYDDSVELAKLLASAAPNRVVWGSDYPHPNIVGEMVDDGILVDLIPKIVPDPEDRHRLLVENPVKLFGFV